MFTPKKTILLMSVLLINSLVYSMQPPEPVYKTETDTEITFSAPNYYSPYSNYHLQATYNKKTGLYQARRYSRTGAELITDQTYAKRLYNELKFKWQMTGAGGPN